MSNDITLAKIATQHPFKITNYALYHNQIQEQQREKEYSCEKKHEGASGLRTLLACKQGLVNFEDLT